MNTICGLLLAHFTVNYIYYSHTYIPCPIKSIKRDEERVTAGQKQVELSWNIPELNLTIIIQYNDYYYYYWSSNSQSD